jgi:hypothetical protein
VAAGPPEEVAIHPESHTGRFLIPLLRYIFGIMRQWWRILKNLRQLKNYYFLA